MKKKDCPDINSLPDYPRVFEDEGGNERVSKEDYDLLRAHCQRNIEARMAAQQLADVSVPLCHELQERAEAAEAKATDKAQRWRRNALLRAATTVKEMLELGDTRLMAGDGPCGGQLPQLSPDEWGKVYRACKKIAALTAQREAAQQAQEPEFVRERWNIERDGDALLVCFNDHEKTEACRYRRFVPEPQVTQEPAAQNIETLKQLLGAALLRLQELGDTSFRFPDSVDTSAPKTVIEATPPSGVREGMLRAAKIAKSMHRLTMSDGTFGYHGNVEEALLAEAEKLPQTHVVVPVEKLKRWSLWLENREAMSGGTSFDAIWREINDMLRAATGKESG